jgi:hydrogenase maturation protease
MGEAVVIGVGNRDRGDDALGLEVARRLKDRLPQGVALLESDGDLAGILDAWTGRRLTLVVDAASAGVAPGTTRRFEAHRRPLPVSLRRDSTHGFGLAEVVELGRALGKLPGTLIVYAVEGHRFERGRALSPAVEAALPDVVDRLLGELEAAGYDPRAEG